MTFAKKYKSPKAGQPLITTITSACKTPILPVKFCNLLKPFYYQNSPNVPRYSITCLVDPEEHSEFISTIQTIEKNEKVETIIKSEIQKKDGNSCFSGKLLIKFQGKDKIPVYVIEQEGAKPELIELEDELDEGENVHVVFDVLRYTKKNLATAEHGISFKPSCIYFYPQEA